MWLSANESERRKKKKKIFPAFRVMNSEDRAREEWREGRREGGREGNIMTLL